MKRLTFNIMVLLLVSVMPVAAEVTLDGFVQGLYGGRLDENNPTATEQTASETRLQLRAEHFGDNAEFFGRLDFVYDGADTAGYYWELREAYTKFRIGSRLDFKVGRQIFTWGTGDLIFINDVFAKDYRSFFVGRDDQYLKAPQTGVRAEFYSGLGGLSAVLIPRFEPNRLPTGRRLSYYNPFEVTTPSGTYTPGIVGSGLDEAFYFDPETPEPKFENGEVALQFSRTVSGFRTSLYFYRGFYKNPRGVEMVLVPGMTQPVFMPVYPRLNVYGASVRGVAFGGVLWLEGGYFDSRDDRDGDNPLMPNSSISGMIGFEKQVATNLTANIQWQADYMTDYDIFASQQPPDMFVRDEVRHLLTSRITKLTWDEDLTLSSFVFYSPSDEDAYVRLLAAYKHTDELELAVGGNIFTGKHPNTEFGQFRLNDNIYFKATYGF